jgi:ADP-ribose pyrophosphatase YjhB (NUDIX family)
MPMHVLQKEILRRLSTIKRMRYAQLKPLRIESNQFTYHIRTLVNRKLIKKEDIYYSLTPEGIRFSDRVNFESFNVRVQPKVVTLIVTKNTEGAYLLYERTKEPFLGTFGFPYGKVHLGEKVGTAASREFKEKCALEGILVHKGIMYHTAYNEDSDILAHMLFHIFKATHTKAVSDDSDCARFNHMRWAARDTLDTLPLMPGVLDALRISEHKGLGVVFEEHEYRA